MFTLAERSTSEFTSPRVELCSESFSNKERKNNGKLIEHPKCDDAAHLQNCSENECKIANKEGNVS